MKPLQFFRTCCFLFATISQISFSQSVGAITFGAQGSYVLPIGSLSERFKPTSGARVLVGSRTEKNLLIEGVAETMVFDKGNDGKDGLYWPDLKVKLEVYGAGVQFQYFLFDDAQIVQPYLTTGAVVYRWISVRGAHAVDTTNVLIVPELHQSDWSLGFQAGCGIEAPIGGSLALNAGVRYQIILGELWPALALHLENVSGFQSLQASLGVKYEFEF